MVLLNSKPSLHLRGETFCINDLVALWSHVVTSLFYNRIGIFGSLVEEMQESIFVLMPHFKF